MKNNIEFAARCGIELLSEGKGLTVYRFDTRYLGGDYTIITIPSPFATEASARLKLFEEICAWDGVAVQRSTFQGVA